MDIKDEARVLRMVDQWECQKLHEKYWYFEGKRDVEAICAQFTDDAYYGGARGKSEIRAKVQGYMSSMGDVLENYHLLPIAVDIDDDGDRARGEIRGVAFIRMRRGEQVNVIGLGVGYIDEFVRTADGWRIASMRAIDPATESPHDTTWRFEVPEGSATFSILHAS